MVWGLFPVDPLPGEETYYIFGKGTYKVGRKGCDVIINKDKGVSRVHAEIIVDVMTSLNPLGKQSRGMSSGVRIRDCSKYGTFVNRNFGPKEKIHELPNKETTMKDEDLVSFGTGNATYRFSFVPIKMFVCCQVNHHFVDQVSLIGASTTTDLSPECTHVIVEQFMTLNDALIDATVSRKPFALNSWLQVLAEKGIRTEIPSYCAYAPTLTLEGVSVRLADPKIREKCLEGYKFVMESTDAYKFRDRLTSLLEVAGAKVLPIEGFCSTRQGSDEGKNIAMVGVIPGGSTNKASHFNKFSSLSTVNEIDLVRAVLAANIDSSILISPSVLISSSCSTDETVVADSDEEVETATSNFATRVDNAEEVTKYENIHVMSFPDKTDSRVHKVNEPESKKKHIMSLQDKNIERIDKVEASESEKSNIMGFQDKNIGRIDKLKDCESENIDVIYSQGLIVRNVSLPVTISSTVINGHGVLNFKRFRKLHTQSGNSFNNLIPYSKHPYRDSDLGNEDVAVAVKEEKKRKQLEAVAEELFNNDKVRRRGVAGTLR